MRHASNAYKYTGGIKYDKDNKKSHDDNENYNKAQATRIYTITSMRTQIRRSED